jgi:hypothetical protein
MKVGIYIMAPERISTAYFINPSNQSVYPPLVARQRLSKSLSSVARQRLSKNFAAATNTHATIGELLDALSAMRSVSHQGK